MNTMISMRIWTDKGQEILYDTENLIFEIEDTFSATRAGTDIYELNANKNNWVALSPSTLEVLAYAKEITASTKGAFNPMVYPLVKAWGFTTSSQQVPSPEEIASILPLVDTTLLSLNEETLQGQVLGGAEVDFGGIAKGYAVDEIATFLEENQVDTALLSLGGNVYTLGKKTDGSLWNIGIQNPYGGGSVGSVAVFDKAIITSGGYQRYFTYEDETYWHIIDPRTGNPAKSGLASVTVISDSGMYGDCLSTALFVMGLEESIAYWNSHQDFDAVFITDEEDIYITEGIADVFTLSKGYSSGSLQVIES